MKTIFSNYYPGIQTVLTDILVPIFGKYTAHNEDVLSSFPEKQNIAQSANITQIKHVANFMLDDKPLDIFDITLSSNARLQYSRVNIQRVVRSLMDVYTGALMFFHYEDNQGDWRISFVEKDDTQKNTTSAKRYTYLVGEHHAVRTVTDRFKILAEKPSKTVETLREAFSVEALSYEFFEKYKEMYADFVQYVTGKRYVKKGSKWEEKFVGKPDNNILLEEVFDNDEKAVRDYVKKTMGRLVFLQFLQKKGWLDVPADQEWGNGNKNYLQDLFNNSDYKDNFLEKVLEPLFFNTLNTKRDNDIATNIPGTFGKIPYLNGGLFENDIDDERVVVFPEKYFKNLIDFFGEYNFTIDENDPNDLEIGIDPEMLGKIFENLLEDNKDKGAYYTPKEIVQYMCKESLIVYLSESKENDKIRQFVSTHITEDFTSDEKEHILQKLKDVKICDPAIGSGAFPMGMLNELFACRTALEDSSESPAQIKREIIQNNIYGVDIEKGAIDIARLRFWLAIVVDSDTPEPLPNFDYKIVEGNSLLTTFNGKYLNISSQQQHENVQAIKIKKEILQKKQKEFFTLFGKEKYEKEKEIKNLILDIIELQLGYERTSWVVKQYRTGNLFQDSEPRQMSFAEIAQKFAPEKQSAIDFCAEIRKSLNDESKSIEEQARTPIPFFDWHIIFADIFSPATKQGGFDIVIGNPPYVSSKAIPKKDKAIFQKIFLTAKGQYDLFCLFIEKSFSLCHSQGIQSFIIPDAFIGRSNFTPIRELFIKGSKCRKLLHVNNVFENANVSSLIYITQCNAEDTNSTFQFTKTSSVKDWILGNYTTQFINQDLIYKTPNYKILHVDKQKFALILKLLNLKNDINDNCYLWRGEEIGKKSNYILDFENTDTCQIVSGSNVQRYYIKQPIKYILIKNVQKSLSDYQKEKILVRQLGNNINATYDKTGLISTQSVYCITSNNVPIKVLLAILNSKLVDFLFQNYVKEKQEFPRILLENLKEIPIPKINKEQQQPTTSLVDKILTAKQENPQTDTSEWEKEIDQLVYQLYGLTDEEITIIEEK